MVIRPPGAAGPIIFRAIRASAYDLPEDFVARIESGLDEDTRKRLEKGLRVLRGLRKVKAWIVPLFIAGIVFLGVGGYVHSRGVGPVGYALLSIAAFCWLGTVAFIAYVVLVSLLHRREIRSVEAFVESARRSSLVRDLG